MLSLNLIPELPVLEKHLCLNMVRLKVCLHVQTAFSLDRVDIAEFLAYLDA